MHWRVATSPAAASSRRPGRSVPTGPSVTWAVCSRRPSPSTTPGPRSSWSPNPSSPWRSRWRAPSLKVFAVGILGQALGDLEHLGGKLGAAAKGPPAGPDGHSVPTDWQIFAVELTGRRGRIAVLPRPARARRRLSPMPDERLTISSSARVHPDEVARHTFGTHPTRLRPGRGADHSSSTWHASSAAGADREQELRRALSEAENPGRQPDPGRIHAHRRTRARDGAGAALARTRPPRISWPGRRARPSNSSATPSRARAIAWRNPRRRPPSSADGPRRMRTPGWRGRSSKRRRSSPRPGPNAAPWSKRHRSCARASSPTWRVAGGCCTARSSSCAPGASDWPRRSVTSGRQSTRSPTSCSGPRTRHGWRQKRPDGRPRKASSPTSRPSTSLRRRRGWRRHRPWGRVRHKAVGGGAVRPTAGRGGLGHGPRR